jgi:predicted transcriptional regulator
MIEKHTRITAQARAKLRADLKKRYERGASVRELADATGRSYGFIHRILDESGVTMRRRGGNTRQPRPASPARTR